MKRLLDPAVISSRTIGRARHLRKETVGRAVDKSPLSPRERAIRAGRAVREALGEGRASGANPAERTPLLLILMVVLLISCRREKEVESPVPAEPTTAARTTTSTASVPPLPLPVNRSNPDRCAGDGSYSQAVDCYRQASRIEFAFEQVPGAKATGEMTRPTPGAERLRFHLTGGSSSGEWTADAKATGVKWSQGGKPVTSEPALADQLWQLTTMYIDPMKKEGQPQRVGMESVGTESCVRYHFTDANSGAAHDVWVSTADGHIAKIQQESRGTFPGYSLTVKKMGK